MESISFVSDGSSIGVGGKNNDTTTTSNSFEEKWLKKTSHLLIENEWPCDRPLVYDGSCYAPERRDKANHILLNALRQNETVTKLVFKNVTFGTTTSSMDVLDGILSSRLKSLELCNVSFLDSMERSSTSHAFPKALVDNDSLTELIVEDNKLCEEDCVSLGRMIRMPSTSLKSLTLNNVRFPNQGSGFEEIMKAVTEIPKCTTPPGSAAGTMRHLDLSRTKLTTKDVSCLCSLLQQNKTIQTLHLDDCGIHRDCAPAIARMLSMNEHLQELSLCVNEIDCGSIRAIVQKGLWFNSTLSSLSLCQNPIGDDGAIYLTDLLCQNSNKTAVESLAIADCEIWSRGYRYLVHGIASMHGLRALMLDGMEMEEHAEELLQSLQTNMTLSQVILTQSSSMILLGRMNDTWKDIFWYLGLNRTGKRRLLVRNDVSSALWPHVLQNSKNHPDYLYYMLRHMPQLVSSTAKDTTSSVTDTR